MERATFVKHARGTDPTFAETNVEVLGPELEADDVFSRNFLLILTWLNFLGCGILNGGALLGPGEVPFKVVPRRETEPAPGDGDGEIESVVWPSVPLAAMSSLAPFVVDPWTPTPS